MTGIYPAISGQYHHPVGIYSGSAIIIAVLYPTITIIIPCYTRLYRHSVSHKCILSYQAIPSFCHVCHILCWCYIRALPSSRVWHGQWARADYTGVCQTQQPLLQPRSVSTHMPCYVASHWLSRSSRVAMTHLIGSLSLDRCGMYDMM